MWGNTLVRTWAKLQIVRAISTAEAEYQALILAAQESLLLQTLLEEFEVKTDIFLRTDSEGHER